MKESAWKIYSQAATNKLARKAWHLENCPFFFGSKLEFILHVCNSTNHKLFIHFMVMLMVNIGIFVPRFCLAEAGRYGADLCSINNPCTGSHQSSSSSSRGRLRVESQRLCFKSNVHLSAPRFSKLKALSPKEINIVRKWLSDGQTKGIIETST